MGHGHADSPTLKQYSAFGISYICFGLSPPTDTPTEAMSSRQPWLLDGCGCLYKVAQCKMIDKVQVVVLNPVQQYRYF